MNIQEKIKEFNDKMDWNKYHTYQDILLALNIEVWELQEHFLFNRHKDWVNIEDVSDEIGDCFIYLIILCNKLKIDYKESIHTKLVKNKEKYMKKEFIWSNKKSL